MNKDEFSYEWQISMQLRYVLALREALCVLLLACAGHRSALIYLEWLVRER